MSQRKAKRFCFTLNNYAEEEYRSICDTLEVSGCYGIVGREVGESGTPHLQGFIIFRDWHVFCDAKNRLNPRCHVEVAKGTPRQNRAYCSKGGDYREFGECPSSGSSSGRAESRDELARKFTGAMESGHDGMVQFADEHPGTFFFSGSTMLRNYQSLQRPINRPNIIVYWYYGLPGTGKSRKAHEESPKAYIKDPKTKWWNGYMFEEEVIIDDYGINCIDINHLLRWFDRYKCFVESKGGMLPLLASKFYVTSNFHPSELFTVNQYNYSNNMSTCEGALHPQFAALMRRINLILFE